MPLELQEYIAGRVWLCIYPVKYLGMKLSARMTVFPLADGRLMLHSPCAIDIQMRRALGALGEVSYIVAPGSFHYLHVASAQAAFPAATTFICPGVERKNAGIRFDGVLGDSPPPAWGTQMDQVLVRGNRWIWEVAFFHRPTMTLVLVDLVENITDSTPCVHWQLKFWCKFVFRMWNNPKPAPEHQLGWKDMEAARDSLRRILRWDFERVILSDGDLIESNARQLVEKAWRKILSRP